MNSPLPYTDTKPVGASDFYFAVNATFRFIERKLGIEGLRRYWTDLGKTYFAPVAQRWRDDGLDAVADHWRAFFAAEPGSEVEVQRHGDTVELRVKVCPMIKHLRDHGREILPCFCQHCYFINESIAQQAALTMRVEGGDGACVQKFFPLEQSPSPQDLTRITQADAPPIPHVERP